MVFISMAFFGYGLYNIQNQSGKWYDTKSSQKKENDTGDALWVSRALK